MPTGLSDDAQFARLVDRFDAAVNIQFGVDVLGVRLERIGREDRAVG